ncbi:arginine repressor [candidate division WOR-3 bacterium]|nr:arginine repressor [candidate division WOR-3 bacterium]
MTLKKRARQDIIKNLIKKKKIGTHVELLKELADRGIKVNQPTISRDLREMGVIKVAKGLNQVIYQLPTEFEVVNLDEIRHKFQNLVIDTKFTNNLIILRTFPGEAQGMAKAIDSAALNMILGTIAGDDTILVVIDKTAHVKQVLLVFDELRTGKKSEKISP